VASFIIGSIDETEEEVQQTCNFIKNSRLDSLDVYLYTPLPGTPVWDYALGKNLVSNSMDWSQLNINFDQNKKQAILLSEKLTREQIIKYYNKIRFLRYYRLVMSLPYSPKLKYLPFITIRILYRLIKSYIKRALKKNKLIDY